MSENPKIHPLVQPLSYILGTWKGEGFGEFPTISSFSYIEELQFSHFHTKPIICYSQKTWNLGSGLPMHAENGFLKVKSDGVVEFVVAQSNGLVEVQKGLFDGVGKVVKVASVFVGNAEKVTRITREYKLLDGDLTYDIEMETNNTSLQTHLKASLKKIENAPSQSL